MCAAAVAGRHSFFPFCPAWARPARTCSRRISALSAFLFALLVSSPFATGQTAKEAEIEVKHTSKATGHHVKKAGTGAAKATKKAAKGTASRMKTAPEGKRY